MSRYSFNLEEVNRERKHLGRPPLSEQQARKVAASASLDTDLGLALLAASIATVSTSTDSHAHTSVPSVTPSFVAGGGEVGGGGSTASYDSGPSGDDGGDDGGDGGGDGGGGD